MQGETTVGVIRSANAGAKPRLRRGKKGAFVPRAAAAAAAVLGGEGEMAMVVEVRKKKAVTVDSLT